MDVMSISLTKTVSVFTKYERVEHDNNMTTMDSKFILTNTFHSCCGFSFFGATQAYSIQNSNQRQVDANEAFQFIHELNPVAASTATPVPPGLPKQGLW